MPATTRAGADRSPTVNVGGVGRKQASQRRDRRLRRGELRLEPGQVRRDELAAFFDVREKHRADLRHGHPQLAETPDDLGRGDLRRGVVAVAGCGVDLLGLEQARFVIVAQRLPAEVGDLREVTDGQHEHILNPPPRRRSTA